MNGDWKKQKVMMLLRNLNGLDYGLLIIKIK